MKFARTSIALLGVQLVIVSTVAAKYLYQRITCPRVWTRTTAYDPSLVIRGRYLSLQLTVDGCGSTLPSAKDAQFQRDIQGVPSGQIFTIGSESAVEFPAKLLVRNDRLSAIRLSDSDRTSQGQMVFAAPKSTCDSMRLVNAVDFYIPENASDPSRLKRGQELWIEVTVPPKGPPRPLQLALKNNGVWKPLAFQ